jgi:hypothetical protein
MTIEYGSIQIPPAQSHVVAITFEAMGGDVSPIID